MRKTLAIVFGLLFVLFAAFQYNDPDPEVWVPIYGFAAVACMMAYARMARPWFFVAMAVIYTIAAFYQWPPVFEGFLLDEIGMKTYNVEMAREAGGLGVCAAAMLVLAYVTREARNVGPIRRAE